MTPAHITAVIFLAGLGTLAAVFTARALARWVERRMCGW